MPRKRHHRTCHEKACHESRPFCCLCSALALTRGQGGRHENVQRLSGGLTAPRSAMRKPTSDIISDVRYRMVPVRHSIPSAPLRNIISRFYFFGLLSLDSLLDNVSFVCLWHTVNKCSRRDGRTVHSHLREIVCNCSFQNWLPPTCA